VIYLADTLFINQIFIIPLIFSNTLFSNPTKRFGVGVYLDALSLVSLHYSCEQQYCEALNKLWNQFDYKSKWRNYCFGDRLAEMKLSDTIWDNFRHMPSLCSRRYFYNTFIQKCCIAKVLLRKSKDFMHYQPVFCLDDDKHSLWLLWTCGLKRPMCPSKNTYI